jgi:hypothetical protein
MNSSIRRAEVIRKAMEIMREHLTREEYLTFLEIFAEQTGDSVIELRENTKDLTINEIMDQIS